MKSRKQYWGSTEYEMNCFSVSKKVKVRAVLRALFSLLLFAIFTSAANAQLVGSPGSKQSAVQRCVPASYWVQYTFEVDNGIVPTGYFRMLFRLEDLAGNLIVAKNYFNHATLNEIDINQDVNPPNNWIISKSHLFDLPPDDDCEYNARIFFYQDSDGPGPLGYAVVDITQIQVLANWHTDDEGDGQIAITPPIHEVCEGEPLVNFRFQDASTFACTIATLPALSKPNDIERNVQFIYGTSPNAAQGIPNLTISVYGTQVQLTDATGAPMPNLWNVNPLDGTIVAPYSTASGFFEGPVISTGPNATGGSQQSFHISYPGGGTVVNDYFEVTLRNWNYCNQWNGSQTNPNAADARTATARIVVVAAPPPPTIADVTICEGGDRTLTVTSAPVGRFRWYSDPALTHQVAINKSTYTPSETAPGSYDFYVVDESLTGLKCTSAPAMVILTINPIPNTPTITRTGADFCFDGSSSITLTADPHSPPAISSYQWYRNGTAVGGAVTNTIVLSTVAQSGNYTVRTFGVAPTLCPSPLSAAITVTIGNPAVVGAGIDQSVCSTANSVNVTGTRSGSATSTTWSTSGTGSFASPTSLNTTYTFSAADKSAGTVTLTITSNDPAGPCPAATDNLVVTISPAATVNAGADQAICSTTATVSVTGTRGGGAGSSTWSTSGTGTFVNAANLNTTYTPSAADISAGTVTLTLTTDDPAGPCGAVSDALLLTISPAAVVGAGADQTICSTSNVALTGTRSGGATSTTWSSSGSGTFANASALNTTYTPSAADISAGTVTLTITSNNPVGPCTAVSDVMVVTINPAATVNAGPDQSICALATATLAGSVGGGAASASWSGGGGTYAPNANTLSAVYTPSAAENTAGTVTLTLTTNDPAGPCGAVTDNVTITIGAPLTGATISGSGNDCDGASSWFALTVNGGAPPYIITYTLDGVAQPVESGYTNGTHIDLGALSVNTHTVHIVSIQDACLSFVPGALLPANYVFTINGLPNAGGTTNNTPALCNNGTTDIVLQSTVPASDFTWTVSNAPAVTWTDAPAGGTRVNGIGTSITQNLEHTATFPTTVTYTITPKGPLPTACPGPDITRTVTVNPTAQVNDPANQVFCAGTAVPALTFTTNRTVGVTTYSWTNSNTAIGLGAGPTAGNLPAFTATNAGTAPISATITVTPTFTNGGVSCTGPAQTFTITVNPTAQVNDPTDQVHCAGTAVPALNFSTDRTVGVTTYSWTNSNTAIGLGAGPTAGNLPAFTATNAGTAPISATITVTPTFTNGGVSCTGPAQTFTITVNPTAQVNDPANQAHCTGTAVPAFNFSTVNTVGTTTYSWTNSNTAIGLGAGPTAGNLPAFTATNAGTAPISATITVTPTFTNGGVSCTGPAQTFTITVNPTAQVNDPTDQVHCAGAAVPALNFSTDRTVGVTTYSWTNSNTAIGLGAGPTAGNLPAFTATNAGTAPISATITVTPTFTNGGVSCSGTAQTFTITVNPTAQVDDPANQVHCAGDAVPALNFSTDRTVGVTTYSWTNSNTAIGLGAGPTAGNLPAFTAANGGTAAISATITVTPTFTNGGVGCSGPARTFTITVNPTPVLNSGLAPADVCSNTPFSYSATSLTAGTSFSWERAPIGGITPAGPTSGLTNTVNETLRNLTSAAIPVTYAFTLTANGCPNAQNVVVNIKPEPAISDQSAAVCSGESLIHHILLDNFINPGDNVTFTWPAPTLSAGVTGGTARLTPSSADMTDVFVNTSGGAETATYTVTPYYNGCTGEARDIVVTIGSQPVLDPGLDMAICSGLPTGLTLAIAPASSPATSYDIFSITVPAGLTPGVGNVTAANTVGANYLANDIFTNLTGVDQLVTYRVRPVFGATCIGDWVNVIVTVRPQPVILPGQTDVVCSNVPTAIEILLVPVNTPAGTTFSWPVPVMSDASVQGTAGAAVAADPSGTLHITDVFENYGVTPITARYTVTPTSSFSCAGNPVDVIITVNPEPAAPVVTGRDKLCVGETNIVYSVPLTAGSTYTWTVPASVGVKTFDFNSNAIIINAAAAAGNGTITVAENNSYGCAGPVGTFNVDILAPSPVSTVTGDDMVCALETGVYSVPNNAGSIYAWSLPPGAALAGDPSGSSVTVTFGTVSGNITVRETNAAGCITNHTPLPVTVRPQPTGIISNSGTICAEGTQPISITLTGTGPWNVTYAINGANQPVLPVAASPYTLNATTAGSYTIASVTDANMCTGPGIGSATVSYFPVPTATISGTTEMCAGGSAILTITLTGAAPYDFTYTDGVTPVVVTNHTAMVYTATVTPAANTTYTITAMNDNNGCLGTLAGNAVITINPAPSLTLTGTNLLCNGDNTGAVDLAVLTGTPAFSYAWTGPDGFTAGTEDISGLKAGYYAVTVTDSKGCKASGNTTLTQPAPLTLSKSGDIVLLCNGATNGAGSFTAAGGTAPYTFTTLADNTGATITPAASSVSITNAGAGMITVQVTDANNCTAQSTINVTQPTALTINATLSLSVEGSHNINCFNGNTGSISTTVTGGVGPYIYAWTTAGGSGLTAGASNQSGLTAGTYDVTVTDANGCTVTGSWPLTQPTELTVTATTDDNLIGTCSDAQLNAVVAGGVMPVGGYLYSWSPAAGLSAANIANPVATPASTTTYSVTVTDANGCVKVGSVTVNVAPVLTATAFTDDNIIGTCSDAQLDVNVNGGEAPYSYSWMPVAGLSSAVIKNPVATPAATTAYTVTVTDANGCTTTANVTVTVAPVLDVTATADDNLIGTCPTSVAHLSAAATGGEGGYSYLWDNAGTLDDATKANPVAKPAVTTTYTVTVTDVNGCTDQATVTVTVAAVLGVTASADDIVISTCPTSVSHLDATVLGGEAPYAYKWAPTTGLDDSNIKTPTAKPAVTTMYTVTVTDANGCTATSNITITVQPALTLTLSVDDSSIGTCPTSDAQISSVVGGGEPGYTYLWTPAAGLSSDIIGNPVAKPAATTTYTLTVTDANGCSISRDITVVVVPDLTAIASASDLLIGTCPTSTSTLDVAVLGGEPGYTYSWVPAATLDNPAIKSPVAKPLATTTYTVTVTDNNGCTATADVTIVVAPPLTAIATTDDAIIGTCPTSVAHLDATAGGGEPGYTYLWSPVAGLSDPNSKIPTAKPAATTTYTVLVTDVNGCTTTSDVTVTVAPLLTVTTTADDYIIGTCPASVANLTAVAGGGEPGYTYLWSPAAGLDDSNIATPEAKPLVTTTYTVLVTDINGCTATSSVTITVTSPLAATASASDPNIGTCPTSVSNLSVIVTGGEAGYTYSWSPAAGLSSTVIANPVAKPAVTTTYTVTVTDVNGCTATAPVTVTVLPDLVATAMADDLIISTCPTSRSNLGVTVTGGEPAYSFSWAPVAGLNNPNVQNPVAKPAVTTTYTVTVTDVNGCQTTDDITITVQPDLTVAATADDYIISTCPTSVANLTGTAAGGEELAGGGYIWNWTPASGLTATNIPNPGAKPASTTTYTVTITDANGCTATNTVTIEVRPPLAATASASDYTIGACPGSSSNLDVTVTGGETPYIYSWVPAAPLSDAGIKDPVATPAVTTTYTVTVTDANGCSVTADVTINVAPPLTAMAAVDDDPIGTCPTSVAHLSTTVAGGEGGYTYLWDNPGTLDDATKANPTAKPAATTLYTVTVTDANGCTATAQVTVNVAPPLTVTTSADDNIIGACPSSVATLNAPGAGGELPLSGEYIYNWSPAAGLNYTNVQSPVAKPAVTTTYTVIITDRNGCTATDQVTITVSAPIVLTTTPVVYAGGYNITCNGASDGSVDLGVAGGEAPFVIAWTGPAGFTAATEDISALVAGTYNVTVSDANGCSAVTTVVLLEPAVLTLGKTPDVIVACYGDATAAGSFTVSGGTAPYTLSEISNNTGATVTVNPTSLTFTGGTAGQITAGVVDANGCTAQATITVTEPAELLPGSIDGTQEVCYLGNPAALNEVTAPLGGPAVHLIQWELSTDGGTIWSIIPGASTASYDPPAGLAVTTQYRRRVTSGACAPVYSNPVTVTVNPLPVASIAGTGFICPGDAATVTVTATTGETPYTVVLSDGTTVANYISGDPITVNPMVTTTYTIASVTDNNGCLVAAPHLNLTGSATITTKVIPEIVIQPADLTVCEDAAVVFTVDAGLTENPSYQWYADSGSGMTLMPGEIGATLNLTAVSAINGNRYEVVVSGDCPSPVTSVAALLTVNEKPEITIQPVAMTLCAGEDAVFTADAGVTTNPLYQWYVDPGSGWTPAVGARYQGATTNTLTVVSVLESMSGYQYRLRVTGTCAPYAESDAVILTVTRQAEITQHPASLSLCEGAAATFAVNAGLTTTPSYQWEISSDGGLNWTPVPGANLATYTIAAVATADNGTAYRAVISSTCGSSLTSMPAYLTVYELPEIITQPVNTTVCEYTIADFTVDAGVTAGATYRWQRSTDSGGTWNNLSESATYFGVSTMNLKVNGTVRTMSGDQFRVIVTGTCLPTVTSDAAILTVDTAPEILTQPVASSICENTNTSFTVNAQGTGITYQWFVDTGTGFNTVSDGGVYSGATTSTLLLTTVPRGYDNYRYRVEITGVCVPKAVSATVQLDVAIETIINTQPADSAICEFMTAGFTALADGANLTYQWQAFSGGVWTDLTNTGLYLGVQTPMLMVFGPGRTMNGTRYRVIISSDCSPDLTSGEAILTVNTAPEITDHPDEVRGCPAGSAVYSVAAVGTNLTYRWQVNSGSGFTDVSDDATYSGTATATLTISNLDLTMNGYLIRAVVTGTCLPPVTSSFAPLRVYMEPSIIAEPADAEVCDQAGATFFSQVFNTGAGETTVWQVNQGAGWTSLSDGALYQGTQTPQLVIMSAATAMNSWLYRLEITGPCGVYHTREALLTVNTPPTAQIAPTDTLLVCGGVPTQLHGNPAGGSGTYLVHRWFGDVGPLSQFNTESPIFNTVMTGYYRLIYQVTDSKGCVGLDTLVVNVEKPVAMFTVDIPSGCQPLTVNFTNGSTGYASVLWDFGDSSTSTDVSPSHTYPNLGPSLASYTARLEVTSSNGCVSTMENDITVYPEILSDFIMSNDTICSGESVMLSTVPSAFTYDWTFGDGNAESGSNVITHIYTNTTTAPVTYDVKLRTQSFFGCISETTMPLVVYPAPVPAFIATPVSQVFPNATVSFTNNTDAGTWTWLWTFGDGNTSTVMSPTHTYAAPGNFAVNLLVSSNGICSDDVTHNVSVLPTPPVAEFDSIPSGCMPWNITVNNTSQYATGYYWDFGDGYTSNAMNPTYTYLQAGTYQITLTVTGPGGTDTRTRLVQVYQAPRAYFEVTPAKVYVNDEKVRLFNLTEGGDSFIWEFGDGDTSHVRDPFHQYTTEGIYDITLHAYSVNGCYDTYVKAPAVTVEPFGDLIFATVFRPNLDGPIEIDELPTSGDAVDQFFYPPVRETVLNYHLQIFDRWGTLIFETYDINRPWNGYYRNKLCQQGVYVWLVEGKYANGRPFKKAGDITLLH